MRSCDQFPDDVWDLFFEFIAPDIEQMSTSEIKGELKHAGIDTSRAFARITEALEACRAQEALKRAKHERPSVVQRLAKVVIPHVENPLHTLETMIKARVPAANQMIYHRKLERVATEDDLRSLLEDLQKLNELESGGSNDQA